MHTSACNNALGMGRMGSSVFQEKEIQVSDHFPTQSIELYPLMLTIQMNIGELGQ